MDLYNNLQTSRAYRISLRTSEIVHSYYKQIANTAVDKSQYFTDNYIYF